MLPGQLVNVLNVPVYLSGHRQRNDSVSSTSSTNRTMNPHDKYMNPRPVPEPSLPRLNTSPVPRLDLMSGLSSATISPWSGLSPVSSIPTSQPTSANGLRMFRLPRKPSVDGPSRSISPQSRMGGLRAKFGSFRTARADSPDESARGRAEGLELEMNISGPIMQHRSFDNRSVKSNSNTSSPASSRQVSPHPIAEMEVPDVPGSYFAIRRPLEPTADCEEAFSAASFQKHRRQRSHSREPSHLRSSSSLSEEADTPAPTLVVTTLPYRPLETLREVASAQNTPTWPVTARRIQIEPVTSPLIDDSILEKRLPTLPNTPSSAYPPSIYSDSPGNKLDKELEALHSHFSISTINSNPTSLDESCPGNSHFSKWTNSTGLSSRGSDYSPKASEYDAESLRHNHMSSFSALGSPFESKSAETLVPMEASYHSPEQLASTTSYSTFSSNLSTSPSSPASDSFEFEHISPDVNISKKPKNIQAYRLPDLSPEANGPLTSVKITPQDRYPSHGLEFASPLRSEFEVPSASIGSTKSDQVDTVFAHSDSMQQLLQELSYLGNMIQK
jgi:hypothetical protein